MIKDKLKQSNMFTDSLKLTSGIDTLKTLTTDTLDEKRMMIDQKIKGLNHWNTRLDSLK